MNGNCPSCDYEHLCAYPYKPCDCRDYMKFVPLVPEQSHAEPVHKVATAIIYTFPKVKK